jgi:hypothetical protein
MGGMEEKPKKRQELSEQIERRKQTVRDGWYFLIVGHVFLFLGIVIGFVLNTRQFASGETEDMAIAFFGMGLSDWIVMVSFGIWKMALARYRRWRALRTSPLTAIVMMLTASGLLWANVRQSEWNCPKISGSQIIVRGWPMPVILLIRDVRFSKIIKVNGNQIEAQDLVTQEKTDVSASAIIIDAVIACAILFIIDFLCEYLVRRADRLKQLKREVSKP